MANHRDLNRKTSYRRRRSATENIFYGIGSLTFDVIAVPLVYFFGGVQHHQTRIIELVAFTIASVCFGAVFLTIGLLQRRKERRAASAES